VWNIGIGRWITGGVVGVDDGCTSVGSYTEIPPVIVLGHYTADLTRCRRICYPTAGSKSGVGQEVSK